MTSTYKLVFRGDIAPGHSHLQVRERLKELFRLDEAGMEKLFCGRPVTIKRNLSEANARVWCETLLKTGAIVESAPEEDASPVPQPQPEPVPQSEPERSGLAIEPPGADVLKPSERRVFVPAQVDTDYLSLDQPGADVLRPEERRIFEELDLDLSHLRVEQIQP